MEPNTDLKNSFALALETSGRRASVAIGLGDEILETKTLDTDHRHASDLLPAIQATCQSLNLVPEKIGFIYVSQGPGSFTGLRIGITVAKMIALGSGARTVGLPTMEVIAQNAMVTAKSPSKVAVILDARRSNLYAQRFHLSQAGCKAIDEVAEVSPSSLLEGLDGDWWVLGEGVEVCRTAIEEAGVSIFPSERSVPRAEVVYRMGHLRASRGEFTPAETLLPVYIRRPSAVEVWEAKHGETPDTLTSPPEPAG